MPADPGLALLQSAVNGTAAPMSTDPGQALLALARSQPASNMTPASASPSESMQSSAPAPASDLTDELARAGGRLGSPWIQSLVRAAGIGTRGVLEGAQYVVNTPANAFYALDRLATSAAARHATLEALKHPGWGWLREPTNAPSSIVSRGLGKVFPTAQNGPEKALQFVTNFLGGGDSSLGAAADLAHADAAPLIEDIAGHAPADTLAGVRTNPDAALARLEGRPERSALTRAQQQAAQGGRELGMRLTPGQATGSKPLLQLEARMESMPWMSGPLARLKAGNARAIGRAAAQAIGEPGDLVDSSVLERANDRLGNVFENVRSPEREVAIDPQATAQVLEDIDAQNAGLLPGDMSIRDNKLVGQLARLAEAPQADVLDEPELSEPPPEHEGLDVKMVGMRGGPKFIVTRDFEPVIKPGADRPEYFDTEEQARAAMPKEAAAEAPATAAAQSESAAAAPSRLTVTAAQLGQLSSKLGRAAFKQMTGPNGDRDLGKALFAVKDHVDDLLERDLPDDERAEYAKARGEYRNLMLLTSRGNILNPSTGVVNGAALASKLQQADRPGFLFGKNQTPLYRAARFAQAFKPIIGDSGTATRSAHLGIGPALGLALAGHLTGLPLADSAELGVLPMAARLAAHLGSRAYLNPAAEALVRGTLGLPRASLRALRNAVVNPGLAAALPHQPLGTLMVPAPASLAPLVRNAHARHAHEHHEPERKAHQWAALVLSGREPALLVHHGLNKFTTIYPPSYPSGVAQLLDGALPPR